MRKSKLYLILAIIISLTLFTTAAICNQCAAASAEEKESTIEEEAAVEEAEEEDSETLESDEEESTEEESDEEEPAEEEEAEEEEEEENIETEAPTINLEIYEGPTYSSSDNICYYRIKATVTGKPTPTVEFSKDDSGGAWGSKKVQINLNDPSDTYNLTATAINSEGTDTDSINLSWGCSMSNNPPEITSIHLPLCGYAFVEQEYEIEALTSDPDGDNLTYEWSTTGGSIEDSNVNPIKWTAPNSPGGCAISLTVDDGKGSTTTKIVSIIIESPIIKTLSYITSESGTIEKNWNASPGIFPYIGDSERDNPVRGYISFDISTFTGATIQSVELTIDDQFLNGFPSLLITGIWLEVVDWGGNSIQLSDYNLVGNLIDEFAGPSIMTNSGVLKDELQEAVDNGKTRFQLRLSYIGNPPTNIGVWDGWNYRQAILKISYVY